MTSVSVRRANQSNRHLTWLRRVADHDFCPALSRRVRGALYHPLGLLLLAAGVAALCGLAVHPRVLVIAAGLVAMAAIGVCWPAVTTRGIRAVLGFDRSRVVEGQDVGVSLIVTNHLPWPIWGLRVADGREEAATVLPSISGRCIGRFQWAISPPMRGVFPSIDPSVASGFPFGLWEARRKALLKERVIVWPRTYPVGPLPRDGEEEVEGGVTGRRPFGGMGEFVGVRPYRRGDSPRRIHWSQSAKHDRLIVCEIRPATRPVVTIILDTREANHTAGPDGTFEWSVRVAASLARGWLESGASVGLAWPDGMIPVSAGMNQVNRIMDVLAVVRSGDQMLNAVLHKPQLRQASGIKVVVTTDAGASNLPSGVRTVVLHRCGFGGHESTKLAHRPWLEIPAVHEVAWRLRHAAPEAIHGS